MEPQETKTYKLAAEVVKTLTTAGHQALFVGGWVRDVHVRRAAVETEIDIATSARPEVVRSLFPRTVGVGQKFGVVLVLCHGTAFEVATFRSDRGYSDGRRPDEVRYGVSPDEDVRRRDFTCNGLFYDPATGEILDFTGGAADIERKVLRAIGEPGARFDEDALRLLRAVRFAKQLGFSLEQRTRMAVAERGALIHYISAERVRDELVKTLAPPGGGTGLRLLAELGLLSEVLPEVEALRGVEQSASHHPEGDAFTHTALILDNLAPGPPSLVMAALLHDIGKTTTRTDTDRIRFHGHASVGAEAARAVMERLRFSRADIENTVDLVARHMDFLQAEKMRPATLKRFLRRENLADHLALHRADCLASHGRLDTYEFVMGKLSGLRSEDLRPKPLLDGRDLMDMGLAPGPLFRRLLAAVEEAQLEGDIESTREALALARKLADEWSES